MPEWSNKVTIKDLLQYSNGIPDVNWRKIKSNKDIDNSNSAIIKIEDYKKMVYDFVDKVEEFYQSSLPKILPKDEFELGAYEEIWEEWRELRNK